MRENTQKSFPMLLLNLVTFLPFDSVLVIFTAPSIKDIAERQQNRNQFNNEPVERRVAMATEIAMTRTASIFNW